MNRAGAGTVFVIAFTAFLAFNAGLYVGKAELRRQTVVRAGSPYFKDVHFGVCAIQPRDDNHSQQQFCATTAGSVP